MPTPLKFEILHESGDCAARTGRVTTPHGCFDTPAFIPVGTQAAIKGLTPEAVAEAGAQIVLANTFHLMLRPGSDLVEQMGGLHAWMRWDRPLLTDSGGYQVFSLADINRVTDDGVLFRSPLDGSTVELTPQRSIQVQNELGADIIMAFDDCPPADIRTRQACERSARWLTQCVNAHGRPHDQALFGIVQGGTDLELRTWCTREVLQHDLPGFAIGGVSVGEGFDGLKAVVEHTAPRLPRDRPRYLMGVGYERDILTAVRAGVDMFDCVLPTRNGRNGNAFTPDGQIRLRNARFARDAEPIDPHCDCTACAGPAGGFSRSYLRHLFQAGEMLGPILVSLHNIRHFQRYLVDIREAIAQNNWRSVAGDWPSSRPPGL